MFVRNMFVLFLKKACLINVKESNVLGSFHKYNCVIYKYIFIPNIMRF